MLRRLALYLAGENDCSRTLLGTRLIRERERHQHHVAEAESRGRGHEGTRSHAVVGRVLFVVPDPGKSGFAGLGGGSGEALFVFARTQEVDEVFHFGQALGRELPDLVDQDLFGGSHGIGYFEGVRLAEPTYFT